MKLNKYEVIFGNVKRIYIKAKNRDEAKNMAYAGDFDQDDVEFISDMEIQKINLYEKGVDE